MEIKFVPQSATEIFAEFVGVEVRGIKHRGWANFLVGPSGLDIATYPDGQSTLSARRMAGILGPEATPAALKKISEVVLAEARLWAWRNQEAMIEAERKRLREASAETAEAFRQARRAMEQAEREMNAAATAWAVFEEKNPQA